MRGPPPGPMRGPLPPDPRWPPPRPEWDRPPGKSYTTYLNVFDVVTWHHVPNET